MQHLQRHSYITPDLTRYTRQMRAFSVEDAMHNYAGSSIVSWIQYRDWPTVDKAGTLDSRASTRRSVRLRPLALALGMLWRPDLSVLS